MNQQGPIGFICPRDGKNVPFDHCFMECKHPCMSIPFLFAIAKTREIQEGFYSTTTIYNPSQIVWLQRNRSYFIKPKSKVFATLGTAWHNVMEEGLRDINHEERKHYHVEWDNYFEVDFGFATLTGRPDLWIDDIKNLRDWKTMKYYTCKKLKAGDWDDSTYHWQLNTYRWFKYPEAEIVDLECIIKDWQTRYEAEGIHEHEIIPVPNIKEDVLKQRAEYLLKLHSDCQKDSSKIIPCTKEDVWYQDNPRSLNDGVPLRCRDYCDVHTVCPQAREWYQANGGWRAANVVSDKRPQIKQKTMEGEP